MRMELPTLRPPGHGETVFLVPVGVRRRTPTGFFWDAIFRGKVVPQEIVETSRSASQGGVKRRRKNVAEK